MRFSNRNKCVAAALVSCLGVFLFSGGPTGKPVMAQSSSASGQNSQPDPYQRSGDVFYMRRMGTGGAERGKEIWYMKCWICHNDYTRAANPNSAPTLKELYKRPVLLSGQPVNDETVAAKIKEGSARMPSYRYVLTDTDFADLLAYLREKCCWDENNPPANPRFKNP